jgi:hypothetical protein
VSGGLTAGLLYGAVFVALQSVFGKLGDDYSAFHGLTAWLVHFTALLPALIGIGLGRNPSGFLSDSFAQFGPLIRKTKPVLFVGIAAEVLIWFLALRHTIHNWTFVILTAVILLALPRIGAIVNPSAFGRRTNEGEAGDGVPLELIGIDRPFTAVDLREIDRGIGVEGSRT